MPFTDAQTAEYMKVIERCFWSKRRPPLHLRDKVREGQRFKDKTIVLFFVRPAFQRPGELIEEPIAKVQHLRGVDDGRWRIFWQRANGQWWRYQPCPEVSSLEEALRVIDEDSNCCFFG